MSDLKKVSPGIYTTGSRPEKITDERVAEILQKRLKKQGQFAEAMAKDIDDAIDTLESIDGVIELQERIWELEGQLAAAQRGEATAHEQAYQADKRVEKAEAELAALRAIRAEEEQIVFDAGPITCRNGVSHERIDDCLYCLIEKAREGREQ